MFWKNQKEKTLPQVSFATTCWEKDYEILLEKNYLKEVIQKHQFPFSEKILIINNVKDEKKALTLAEKRIEEGSLTHVYLTSRHQDEVLSFFSILPHQLTLGKQKEAYPHLNDNWVFYNALGPLSSLFLAKSPYLLYQTGDVCLETDISWIAKAILFMQKHPKYKVANPLWNQKNDEAKEESFRKTKDFYLCKKGFSDQMFLLRRKDFFLPLYDYNSAKADHFPRGEVFEKKIYCVMLEKKYRRIIFKHGSYCHPCH
jgi:hypothetical protein